MRVTFNALGCYDCARVDMRLDAEGNFYILEINSLPSMGEHGFYVAAAQAMGMDSQRVADRKLKSVMVDNTVIAPQYHTVGEKHPLATIQGWGDIDYGTLSRTHQGLWL